MEIENQQAEVNKYKRKRKKTFLRNARKYAKKGCYGRGSQLDADTYQYFVRIMEAYREGFENEEDKRIFVDNVFQQTENEEINCSRNQVGCRVIEMLLPFANDSVIERYVTAFADELRPLCTDRFASHVLEALLTQCCKRSLDTNDTDSNGKFKEFTLKISKFLLNNLEDFVWDMYANHVIRSVYKNLIQLPADDIKFNKTAEINHIEIPSEYSDVLKDYGERLIVWPQFKDLPYTEITSGMLQILLKALAKADMKLLKKYVKKILDESLCGNSEGGNLDDGNKFPDVFTSKPALMLLEVMIEIAIPKHFTQIYAKYFKNHLKRLAVMSNTNFAVQKLLSHCSEKIEFEEMYEELNNHFEEIISMGNTGIILALARTCKRLSTKQGSFVQNLTKVLHCETDDRQNDLLLCLCKFKTYEQLQELKITDYETEKLNPHGTLILQSILEFNKPIKFVNGILNMNTNDLKGLFSNAMGSRIADSYVNSKFIGEKSREKLIWKLQGVYQDLAKAKYGSRSFEAIWSVCNMKFRMNIMNELSYKDAGWSNTMHGKIIASKINLALYKRNKEEWKSTLSSANKIKELTDLLK